MKRYLLNVTSSSMRIVYRHPENIVGINNVTCPYSRCFVLVIFLTSIDHVQQHRNLSIWIGYYGVGEVLADIFAIGLDVVEPVHVALKMVHGVGQQLDIASLKLGV